MRRAVRGVGVLAAVGMLAGCTAAGEAGGPRPTGGSEVVQPAATGPELWGAGAIWVSPEGEQMLCASVPGELEGWGPPQVCTDPLQVSGFDAETIETGDDGSRTTGLGEDGWSWSAHVLSGHLAGEHFTVTAVDTPALKSLAEARNRPPEPVEQPVTRTEEEKQAAYHASMDPAIFGCEAPDTGWSSVEGWWLGAVEEYERSHPGAVVGWNSLWPSPGVEVALVGAAAGSHLEAVRADLAALLPNGVCVVESKVSSSDLTRALAEPAFGPDPYLSRAGQEVDGHPTADPYFWLSTTAVSPELTAALETYPPGFVLVSTWFEPLP
ncbi:hypothetical protein [Herbiconiux sp.]|uniref:hypothetical protein n=1 Tax=Herbiconiux sp. TaxID=1871186 RepID=UPI0025BAFA9B|nr:hypothetical protein [Herbiconiux sp.]